VREGVRVTNLKGWGELGKNGCGEEKLVNEMGVGKERKERKEEHGELEWVADGRRGGIRSVCWSEKRYRKEKEKVRIRKTKGLGKNKGRGGTMEELKELNWKKCKMAEGMRKMKE
jgi:hypothetical protein